MPPPRHSALVIIPTYNEAENLEPIVRRVLASDVDVLIVDDASPDGTGALADRLAEDPRVSVLHRLTKDGLGPAYLAGFDHGLARGYDVLIELDADGSHPPERIPDLLAVLAADTAGAVGGVIGSRWVAGGSIVGWPRRREWISRAGSWYARSALGLPVRDVTAGFRAYRAAALRDIHLEDVASQGYCFQIDLTRRMVEAGHRLVEVPIEFRDREHGTSKMRGAIIAEAMLKVTGWGIQRLWRRPRRVAEG